MNPANPKKASATPQRARCSRVKNADEAVERYGQRARLLFAALRRGDPLADAVAERLAHHPEEWPMVHASLDGNPPTGRPQSDALRALIDEASATPAWVDRARVARAGKLFFRTGLPGGIVLGAKSLCHGYCSPAGNKPLIMTGRLDGPAMGMRLAETSKFVVQTCRPGGLEPFAAGFAITLKVRLMHAVVRRLLQNEKGWDDDSWGLPINQHDMLGTALLFSLSFVEGVQSFGFHVPDCELEDYLHLWRYSSYLMGVEDALYPKNAEEARDLAAIILLTQGSPDEDARSLVDALVTAPLKQAQGFWGRLGAQAQTALGYGFCRTLLGQDLADALQLPAGRWDQSIAWVRPWVGRLDTLRRYVPGLERRMQQAGERYWDQAIRQGMQGRKARFRAGDRLVRRPKA